MDGERSSGGEQTSNRPSGTPTTFSALLNYLLATRLAPEGRPYTPGEVSKATGLSESYLSRLRSGKIARPPLDRVEKLASFFGVPVDYFTGRYTASPLTAETPRDEALWEALSKPLVREVALRAGKVSSSERALILEMLQRAEELARLADVAAASTGDADQDPWPTESTDDDLEDDMPGG